MSPGNGSSRALKERRLSACREHHLEINRGYGKRVAVAGVEPTLEREEHDVPRPNRRQ